MTDAEATLLIGCAAVIALSTLLALVVFIITVMHTMDDEYRDPRKWWSR